VPFFAKFIPRKGKVLSVAVSIVKFKEECFELKTSKKEVATWGPSMTVKLCVFNISLVAQ